MTDEQQARLEAEAWDVLAAQIGLPANSETQYSLAGKDQVFVTDAIAAMLAFRAAQPGEGDQELQEIADGAYGDGPRTRGLARDALAQPRPDCEAVARQACINCGIERSAASEADSCDMAHAGGSHNFALPSGDGAREVERLRALAQQINGYASHSLGCALYQRSWASGAPPCTCGLDEARAALGAQDGGEA